MQTHTIKAQSRTDEGKGASRRLRRAGSIPAVVYGGLQKSAQSIQLDHESIWLCQEHEWFYSSILNLDIDGKKERVLLRDMQRHPYKRQVMHIDFQRVNENQMLTVSVPLHFKNTNISPAGKTSGVIVTHELNEVQVACLPKDLPSFIEIDLSQLDVGQVIHLSDIALPAGVEIPALKTGKEHNTAVVIAKHASSTSEDDSEQTPAAGTDTPTKS